MRLLERLRAASLGLALSLAGCAGGAPYVWVNEVARADLTEGSSAYYVIASGDVLAIRCYNQDAVTTRARVRPDGRISVPLAGEIEAEGRRPADLAREIEARLKPFFVAPAVIVAVEEAQPLHVAVLGEVARPGVYPLEPRTGVLAAIAAAGGLSEYAARDRIFVLRRRPAQAPLRVRFTLGLLSGEPGRASQFALVPGDVVTVE
jgi:polysaccharide export outer membrane protein